jgi:hypothetical protein
VSYLLRALFAALSLALPSASAGFEDRQPKPVAYFPTQVGAKWTYETAGGGEAVCVLTAAEGKGDETSLTLEWEYKDKDRETQKTVEKLRVSTAGVYRLGIDKKVYDPPECMLKLPFEFGGTWEWRLKGDDKFKKPYKAVAEEEVKVPAGSYKALRVESGITGTTIKLEWTYWYAPDVGIVKRRFKDGLGFDVTYLLKSFVAGKK